MSFAKTPLRLVVILLWTATALAADPAHDRSPAGRPAAAAADPEKRVREELVNVVYGDPSRLASVTADLATAAGADEKNRARILQLPDLADGEAQGLRAWAKAELEAMGKKPLGAPDQVKIDRARMLALRLIDAVTPITVRPRSEQDLFNYFLGVGNGMLGTAFQSPFPRRVHYDFAELTPAEYRRLKVALQRGPMIGEYGSPQWRAAQKAHADLKWGFDANPPAGFLADEARRPTEEKELLAALSPDHRKEVEEFLALCSGLRYSTDADRRPLYRLPRIYLAILLKSVKARKDDAIAIPGGQWTGCGAEAGLPEAGPAAILRDAATAPVDKTVFLGDLAGILEGQGHAADAVAAARDLARLAETEQTGRLARAMEEARGMRPHHQRWFPYRFSDAKLVLNGFNGPPLDTRDQERLLCLWESWRGSPEGAEAFHRLTESVDLTMRGFLNPGEGPDGRAKRASKTIADAARARLAGIDDALWGHEPALYEPAQRRAICELNGRMGKFFPKRVAELVKNRDLRGLAEAYEQWDGDALEFDDKDGLHYRVEPRTGRLLSAGMPGKPAFTFAHDDRGQLTGVTDPISGETLVKNSHGWKSNGRPVNGNLSFHASPRGLQRVFSANGGKVIQLTDFKTGEDSWIFPNQAAFADWAVRAPADMKLRFLGSMAKEVAAQLLALKNVGEVGAAADRIAALNTTVRVLGLKAGSPEVDRALAPLLEAFKAGNVRFLFTKHIENTFNTIAGLFQRLVVGAGAGANAIVNVNGERTTINKKFAAAYAEIQGFIDWHNRGDASPGEYVDRFNRSIGVLAGLYQTGAEFEKSLRGHNETVKAVVKAAAALPLIPMGPAAVIVGTALINMSITAATGGSARQVAGEGAAALAMGLVGLGVFKAVGGPAIALLGRSAGIITASTVSGATSSVAAINVERLVSHGQLATWDESVRAAEVGGTLAFLLSSVTVAVKPPPKASGPSPKPAGGAPEPASPAPKPDGQVVSRTASPAGQPEITSRTMQQDPVFREAGAGTQLKPPALREATNPFNSPTSSPRGQPGIASETMQRPPAAREATNPTTWSEPGQFDRHVAQFEFSEGGKITGGGHTEAAMKSIPNAQRLNTDAKTGVGRYLIPRSEFNSQAWGKMVGRAGGNADWQKGYVAGGKTTFPPELTNMQIREGIEAVKATADTSRVGWGNFLTGRHTFTLPNGQKVTINIEVLVDKYNNITSGYPAWIQ